MLFKILHLPKQGNSEEIIQDRPKTYGGCTVEKERGTELDGTFEGKRRLLSVTVVSGI